MITDLASVMRRNRLLNSLSGTALEKIQEDLTLRTVHLRDLIVGRGEPIVEVMFPVTSVFSMVSEGARGEPIEVATVGNEGLAGLSIFLGVEVTTTIETFAQIAGEALVLRARDFRAHLQAHAHLRETMGRYTQALLTQIAQSAACNRLHSTEERMARWLLMTHDRVGQEEFDLTQEFLGQMLGVRRATISEVATALQADGLIQYSRGTMAIRDRNALMSRSCECYRVIRDEYERLVPGAGGTNND